MTAGEFDIIACFLMMLVGVAAVSGREQRARFV